MADMICADADCGGKMKNDKCVDCGGTKEIPAAFAKNIKKPSDEGADKKKSPLEKWMGKGKE
jgi:hypothetical protein